jgi:radical SAM superfamily enzyme YgiQ (UPF0313 family)
METQVKKRVAIVGLYMPGIYPPGDETVPFHFLSSLYLKSVGLADAQLSASYDLRIFDIPTSKNPQEIAHEIFEYRPDVVAYTVYVWNYQLCKESSELLKKWLPKLRIILGGPQVEYDAEENLEENPQADVIVMGSGESRFVQILKDNFEPEKLSQIPRVAYRDSEGLIVNTGGTFKEDITKIPSPYQSDAVVDLNDGKGHTILVETYRGCPFTCNYCIWGDLETKLDLFPIEQILKDIEIIYSNPNIKTVVFADACLFYTRERAKIIIDKIAEGIYKIPTFLSLDILIVNEEMIEYLKKVPIYENSYNFGLQSTNPLTLELSGRKSQQSTFEKKIALIKEMSPTAELSFDLLYGLPGDNLESFRETINFGLNLSSRKLYFSNLILLPGTDYWDKREEFGFKYGQLIPHVVASNNTYSKDDMEKSRELVIWVLHLLYFPAIRDMIYEMTETNPKLKRIDLLEEYREIMERQVNPIAGIDLNLLSVEGNNQARRKVFYRFSQPDVCLISYDSALELLETHQMSHMESLNRPILLGRRYYRTVCEKNEVEAEKSILKECIASGLEKVTYKWRVPRFLETNSDDEIPVKVETLA